VVREVKIQSTNEGMNETGTMCRKWGPLVVALGTLYTIRLAQGLLVKDRQCWQPLRYERVTRLGKVFNRLRKLNWS